MLNSVVPERQSLKQKRSQSIKKSVMPNELGSPSTRDSSSSQPKKSHKKSFFGIKILQNLLGKRPSENDVNEHQQDENQIKVVEINGLKMYSLIDIEKHTHMQQEVLLQSYKFILNPSKTITEEEEDSDGETEEDDKQMQVQVKDDDVFMVDKIVQFQDLQYLNIYELSQRKDFLQNIYGLTPKFQTTLYISLPYQKPIHITQDINPFSLDGKNNDEQFNIRPMESVRTFQEKMYNRTYVPKQRRLEQLIIKNRSKWHHVKQIFSITQYLKQNSKKSNLYNIQLVLKGDINKLRMSYLKDQGLMQSQEYFEQAPKKFKMINQETKLQVEIVNTQFN